jgi:hypothetical protein
MTEDTKDNPRKSRSLNKVNTRLNLTLQHLDIVDDSLNRCMNTGNRALIKHAITRNCQATIQILYSHLNEYLKSILSDMMHHRPLMVVDKAQGALQFQEILRLGDFDAMCEVMVERVFRKLENNSRDMGTVIGKILDNTGADIDKVLLDDAMKYIEMRHLIVHNLSRIDERFANTYRINYAKPGKKLNISIGVARSGISAVRKLCENIDRELCANGYVGR